jgi:hypothetical protein
MTILVKIPRQQTDLGKTKLQLLNSVNEILREKENRNSRIVIDVDPL